ncbi:MAG: polynucleotide adenylyltransferase PcnB [Spirochaetales bacterium]|nr:polynucleotide adenylyltransferase PcnB [Spirochaetales bacterium]
MLTRYSPDSRGKAVRKALIYTKNEHAIRRELIDPEAVRIVSHLRNYGYEGYLVGGAVRDLLIGKTPKDFDIVTNAEPAKIKRLFRNSRIIGKRFRLVHIFFGEKIFEVSTFRSLADGTTGNSFGTMDEDVQRRDFTMNALYYDPLKEQLIDYVGGVKDIRNRMLKPVIPLKIIFKDDPVRMLRAVKYSVSTGCRIPFSLRFTLNKSAPLLQPVSPSRLTEEIIKIVNSGNAHGIVENAIRYGLFMYLQPAAASMIDGSAGFSRNYASSLEQLDLMVAKGEDCRLGRKLVFLIKDLVQIIADWNGPPSEVYNKVYHECRRYIMPMNPPRIELEFAVRFCLKEGGLHVRMPKPRDKKGPEGDRNRPRGDAGPDEGREGKPAPRRRRRRRKPESV